MSIDDAMMTREVIRDICRHPVDISNLSVHVQHGVVYLQGRLEPVRGYWDNLDMHEELGMILKMLHQKMGIRDVVCDVDMQGATLHERMTQKHRRRISS